MVCIMDRETKQMQKYKPTEHDKTMCVVPLMQFFELVHIGDTIQLMVRVYLIRSLRVFHIHMPKSEIHAYAMCRHHI